MTNDKDTSQVTPALEVLLGTIDTEIKEQINAGVQKEFSFLREIAKAGSTLHIKMRNKTNEITGLRHKNFEDLVKIVANRIPTLLVGPAGTGKTHAAEQAAQALDVNFYAMSVGMQTSKSDIIGFMSANGRYIQTAFRQAFEFGGLFLMDEIDSGNANVLIQINAALANNYCQFPDKMVKRHEDFVFVGSANTYGDGASRQYVGRSQLDAATIDRFAMLDWPIDEKLEELIAGSAKDAQKWLRCIRELRAWTSKNVERVIVSPRATQRGVTLLNQGMSYTKVAEIAVLGAFPVDKRSEAMKVIKSAWSW